MDIERIQRIIEEHGIPRNHDDIIRTVRSATGHDVTHIVRPTDPARDQSTNVFLSYSNRHELFLAYNQYRASKRMSAARLLSTAPMPLSVGRSSSPMGSLNNSKLMTVRSYLRDYLGEVDFPCPVVFDQNTRVDYDPGSIGYEDHIRIQSLISRHHYSNFPRPPITTPAGVNVLNNLSERRGGNNFIDRTRLTAFGWETLSDDTFSAEPYAAIRNASDDPNGRHLIMFVTPDNRHGMVAYTALLAKALDHIKDRWTSGVTEQTPAGPSQEAVELAQELRSISAIGSSLSGRIDSIRDGIASYRRSADQAANTLAECLRTIDESTSELSSLEGNLTGRVLNEFRAISGLVDQVSSLRQVMSASLESEAGSTLLSFTTWRYGMRRGERIVILPQIKYMLNLTESDFSRAVRVYKAHRSDHRYIHPHATGSGNGEYSICWGNAARPMAESWARRDWISFIRIMLGWHTQYNGNSPYIDWGTLWSHLPHGDTHGWLNADEHPNLYTGVSFPLVRDPQPEVEESINVVTDNNVEDVRISNEDRYGHNSFRDFVRHHLSNSNLYATDSTTFIGASDVVS